MKKLSTSIAIALLLIAGNTNQAQAQETQAKVVTPLATRFGLKGGANLANLYVDDIDDKNQILGFNLGLFAKVPLTRHFAIQPELYFTTKGSELTYNNSFVVGNARFNLNYIEIPVLAVINITSNFNIHAGPYAGYLIHSKVSNESSGTAFDFENNINEDDYNRVDAGLQVGAGIDIGSIGIGARYSYGMTTVGKERNFLGTSYTFPDAKNSVFNLYISLALR